jgi:hypothetical protein
VRTVLAAAITKTEGRGNIRGPAKPRPKTKTLSVKPGGKKRNNPKQKKRPRPSRDALFYRDKSTRHLTHLSRPNHKIFLFCGKSFPRRDLLNVSGGGGPEGDRREVSLSLKCPVIMSQTSLVKQISENVPSVPEFVPEFPTSLRCAFCKLEAGESGYCASKRRSDRGSHWRQCNKAA